MIQLLPTTQSFENNIWKLVEHLYLQKKTLNQNNEKNIAES